LRKPIVFTASVFFFVELFAQKITTRQYKEDLEEAKVTGIKGIWSKIVSPRKPVCGKPLIVLVDHWTGSVGEGIAIGLMHFFMSCMITTPL